MAPSRPLPQPRVFMSPFRHSPTLSVSHFSPFYAQGNMLKILFCTWAPQVPRLAEAQGQSRAGLACSLWVLRPALALGSAPQRPRPDSFPGRCSQPHNFNPGRHDPCCPLSSRHPTLKKGPWGSPAPGGSRAHPVRLLLLRGDGTQRPLQVADALLGRLQETSEVLRLPWNDGRDVRRRDATEGPPCARPEDGRASSPHLSFAGLLAECGPGPSVVPSSQTLGSLWSGCEPSGERPNGGGLRTRKSSSIRGTRGNAPQSTHL